MTNNTLPATLTQAREADQQDPFHSLRAEFVIPEGVIYLDGNSLGCLPKRTAEHLQQVVSQQWGEGLIRSWNQAGWLDLPQRVGALIAPLVGAHADEVVMTDSTSINLFKLAAAALRQNAPRREILVEADNFPTDAYIMQGLAEHLREQPTIRRVPSTELGHAISPQTALVVVTEVHYKTGAKQDMAQFNALAHEHGALVLWDLSHSTGVIPVELNASQADYAVGCGYKYLNGGPGAPAFAYVARAHQARLQQPLWGWFGHEQPFAMQYQYAPAQGINQLLTGTTSILAGSALEKSLSVFAGIDRVALREKSKRLTQLLIEQVQAPELELVSPQDPDHRGSQVSWRHPQGYAITQALIARGVIGDFRSPDIIRMGVAPLYIGYEDIYRAAAQINTVLNERLWDRPEYHHRHAVT